MVSCRLPRCRCTNKTTIHLPFSYFWLFRLPPVFHCQKSHCHVGSFKVLHLWARSVKLKTLPDHSLSYSYLTAAHQVSSGHRSGLWVETSSKKAKGTHQTMPPNYLKFSEQREVLILSPIPGCPPWKGIIHPHSVLCDLQCILRRGPSTPCPHPTPDIRCGPVTVVALGYEQGRCKQDGSRSLGISLLPFPRLEEWYLPEEGFFLSLDPHMKSKHMKQSQIGPQGPPESTRQLLLSANL